MMMVLMDIPRQFQHLFFHVSPKRNRAGIEANGLEANDAYNDQSDTSNGVGVFISHEPDPSYGDDIYGIENPPTGRKATISFMGRTREYDEGKHDLEDALDTEGVFIPHDVPTSDFKRIGHVFSNNGHPEIHWHKEEECPDE
jgi:hypothetical protein